MKNYQFAHFKEFFEHQLRENTYDERGKKITTLQELANKMGYRSPSLLSMVAKGHRLPSASLMEALFTEWKIEKKQREMLRLRVEIERKLGKGKDTYALLARLAKLIPKEEYQIVNLDMFNSIREWYVIVVLMMVELPDFKEDYHLISNKLRKKVTASQVERAIEILLNVKLLERNPETGKLQKPAGSFEAPGGVPSEAIREHHKSMIHRALEANEEQTILERFIMAVTLPLERQRLDDAKEKLTSFLRQFNEEFGTKTPDSVYQLNIQFFEHTKFEENGKYEN